MHVSHWETDLRKYSHPVFMSETERRVLGDGELEALVLAETGKAILDDEDTYGVWLDTIAGGKPRARRTVDQLRNRIEEDRVDATKAAERERKKGKGQRKGRHWSMRM